MDNGKPKFIDHAHAMLLYLIAIVALALIFGVPPPHWLRHLLGK